MKSDKQAARLPTDARLPTNAPQNSACGSELPEGTPRNERGQPYREAGDDCCPYYHFREETAADYHRCGWCQDFDGSGKRSVCVNENNRRETE